MRPPWPSQTHQLLSFPGCLLLLPSIQVSQPRMPPCLKVLYRHIILNQHKAYLGGY